MGSPPEALCRELGLSRRNFPWLICPFSAPSTDPRRLEHGVDFVRVSLSFVWEIDREVLIDASRGAWSCGTV